MLVASGRRGLKLYHTENLDGIAWTMRLCLRTNTSSRAAQPMFDIAFWELVLLALVGLLMLDAKRLLQVATELGKWLASARRTVTELHRQLQRETGFKEEVVEHPRPKLRMVPRDPGKSAANEQRSV
jgi:Sec-independent protein translocase protein TatA